GGGRRARLLAAGDAVSDAGVLHVPRRIRRPGAAEPAPGARGAGGGAAAARRVVLTHRSRCFPLAQSMTTRDMPPPTSGGGVHVTKRTTGSATVLAVRRGGPL